MSFFRRLSLSLTRARVRDAVYDLTLKWSASAKCNMRARALFTCVCDRASACERTWVIRLFTSALLPRVKGFESHCFSLSLFLALSPSRSPFCSYSPYVPLSLLFLYFLTRSYKSSAHSCLCVYICVCMCSCAPISFFHCYRSFDFPASMLSKSFVRGFL